MVTQLPRRLIRLERYRLANTPGKDPVWLIVHSTYSDGSDVYDVHALDGSFPPAKFHLHADMQHYLRKRGYRQPLPNPRTSDHL